MRILISGWYGHGNAGDELLLDVFLARYRHHDVTVLTTGRIDSRRAISVRHAHLLRLDTGGLKQWIRGSSLRVLLEVLRADCVVLGGGGILRERGNIRNLRRLTDELFVAHFLRRKKFVYGVSIGPIESAEGKTLIRRALALCDHVTVRDRRSMEYLREFAIPKERTTLAPDPVFTLPAAGPSGRLRDRSIRSCLGGNGRVPLFLSHSIADGDQGFENLDRLAFALDRAAEDFGLGFLAVPFRTLDSGGVDDRWCARELAARMTRHDTLLCHESSLTTESLEELIELSRFTICVRLHSMILSIVKKTPFVAVSYDTKVRDTAVTIGLGDRVVEMDDAMGQSILDKIAEHVRDPDGERRRVGEVSSRVRLEAEETFRRLDRLLLV